MKNVLVINKIRKRYPNLNAVMDLSLKVDKGNVFGILGPNGSGKTTTLGLILGVINATSGSYSWFGQPESVNTRKKIGALLETPNFHDGLSGLNNLRIVAKIKNVPEEDIQRVAKMVELDGRMLDKFRTYSLGMKQRLAIASTLLGNPEVIILDEPANGLDPKGIIDIRKLIIKITNQGVTVLLASHALDEVEKVCTHVCILKKGSEVIQGKIVDLVKGENFVEVSSEDLENLKKVISEFNGTEEITQEKGKLLIRMSPDIKTTELNQHLTKHSIVINHFVSRKKSLEKFYLESTE